ncbi:MAG: histidine kinase dimerization/phospho-acceptor domain-containing protein [Candidatus Omnitrophota bacterium]
MFFAGEIGRGKLDTAIEIKSKDEIGFLANTINQMALDLKKSRGELENFTADLEQKVKKRTKEVTDSQEAALNISEDLQEAKEDLERANKRLLEIDRIKSDFVSHELRTPLTTMREANAQLLEGLHGSLNEGQRKFLEISQRGVIRLSRIINDLLDISRLEAGKMQLEKKLADVVVLAKDAVDSVRPLARQKRIELEDKLPPFSPEIFVDPDRIKQVFINLAGNAIEYTQEGGRITISAEKKPGRVEISVTDTGIGISGFIPKGAPDGDTIKTMLNTLRTHKNLGE